VSEPADEQDFSEVMDRTITHVTAFVRRLRFEGVEVPANAGIDAVRAVCIVGVEHRNRTRLALRATLIARKEDIEPFERLFPQFWEHLLEDLEVPRASKQLAVTEPSPFVELADEDEESESFVEGEEEVSVPDPDAEEDDQEGPEPPSSETASPPGGPETDEERDARSDSVDSSTYSKIGVPRTVDLEGIQAEDRLDESVAALAKVIGNLKGRRWEPDSTGRKLDVRRALRRSFGSGGTVPDIPMRSRKRSIVRGVVFVDVSKSVLDTIDRGFLIRFLQAMYDGWRNVHIFFFDTDVRDVTDSFAVDSAREAVLELRRAEAQWGGGTRIGHALATIRTEYPDAIDRETSVFVISDGLEAGEIDRLKSEMAAVRNRVNHLFWLNPLAASREYQPTARGMDAVLPYIDGLFAFAGEDDVAEVARQLRLRGPGGSIGYQFDTRDRAIE
jgi:uncharacterized protein with von Willebrand factor type A (vWA) domain